MPDGWPKPPPLPEEQPTRRKPPPKEEPEPEPERPFEHPENLAPRRRLPDYEDPRLDSPRVVA